MFGVHESMEWTLSEQKANAWHGPGPRSSSPQSLATKSCKQTMSVVDGLRTPLVRVSLSLGMLWEQVWENSGKALLKKTLSEHESKL